MNVVITAIEELYGLFVDDGSLAIGILFWVGIVIFVVAKTPAMGVTRGIALFLGLVALLLENVARSARRRD